VGKQVVLLVLEQNIFDLPVKRLGKTWLFWILLVGGRENLAG